MGELPFHIMVQLMLALTPCLFSTECQSNGDVGLVSKTPLLGCNLWIILCGMEFVNVNYLRRKT